MKIPYGRQFIDDEDINEVIQSLKSDFLTQGPRIAQFEEDFAKYVGSKYALAVSNGTAALHLCCLALNVNQHSKVITTPITFAASANCVSYCGGEVVFSDIDPNNALLDISKVRRLLEEAPKGTYSGIIPVDFAGFPVNLQSFRELADEHNLWIIEDACHAPGGSFTDKDGNIQKCGNGVFADLAIFSFHPVKHIACGEGGMITTNDQLLYERILYLRTHGITKRNDLIENSHGGWFYDMVELGYNYRLTDIQCALGRSQLKKADKGIERRRAIASKYVEAFKGSAVTSFEVPKSVNHAYHLFVIQIAKRKQLYDSLSEKGIFAQVHYIPTHTLQYYRNKGYNTGDFPLAEAYYNHCLSLPMYPTLTNEEQEYVIKQVLDIVDNG